MSALPTREQRSLFGEILDWMLAPLLLLWPMSVALTWLVAQNIASRPFDRDLAEMARTIARQVVVVNYSGNGADLWWDRHRAALSRLKNLTVIDFRPEAVSRAVELLERSMRLTAMIQDGELQLMNERMSVLLPHGTRMTPAG